jgi:hypothetical protein
MSLYKRQADLVLNHPDFSSSTFHINHLLSVSAVSVMLTTVVTVTLTIQQVSISPSSTSMTVLLEESAGPLTWFRQSSDYSVSVVPFLTG